MLEKSTNLVEQKILKKLISGFTATVTLKVIEQ